MHTDTPETKPTGRLPFVIIAALILSVTALPACGAAEPQGVDRALEQRAIEITTIKNDFVKKALLQNRIPHQLTEKGVVVRIQIGGTWETVDRIEIVPVLRNDGQGDIITTHEIYFTTKSGIHRVVSDLAIKKGTDGRP